MDELTRHSIAGREVEQYPDDDKQVEPAAAPGGCAHHNRDGVDYLMSQSTSLIR